MNSEERTQEEEGHRSKAVKVSDLPNETIAAILNADLSHLPLDERDAERE